MTAFTCLGLLAFWRSCWHAGYHLAEACELKARLDRLPLPAGSDLAALLAAHDAGDSFRPCSRLDRATVSETMNRAITGASAGAVLSSLAGGAWAAVGAAIGAAANVALLLSRTSHHRNFNEGE